VNPRFDSRLQIRGDNLEPRAALSTDVAWSQESHDWPSLEAIGKITATREINGKNDGETCCYLASRAFTPGRFSAIGQSHWASRLAFT